MELMEAVDSYIPDPVRDTDKPFLMPIEDVFTITGRGTVYYRPCRARGTLKLNLMRLRSLVFYEGDS